jgi:hypothetical protein
MPPGVPHEPLTLFRVPHRNPEPASHMFALGPACWGTGSFPPSTVRAAGLGGAPPDVHRPEEDPADQLAVPPDAVDPRGVGRGLVRVLLAVAAARLQVGDGLRQPDVPARELPAPVHVGQERLGMARFERARLGSAGTRPGPGRAIVSRAEPRQAVRRGRVGADNAATTEK